MAKITPISNDISFLNEDQKDGTKRNLGGGLYVYAKNGKTYYQVRFGLNGSDTTKRIGSCNEISVTEARKVAEQLRSDVEKLRKKEREIKFKTKINNGCNKTEFKGHSTFRNMKDAWFFIQELFVRSGIKPELRYAIWLQMLIPAKSNDLLIARWDSLNKSTSRLFFTQGNTEQGNSSFRYQRFAYLPSNAWHDLDELFNFTGNSPYLFPTLANMEKTERNKVLSVLIKELWSNYPINPGRLRDFFCSTAKQYSQFKPEFIDSISENSYMKSPIEADLYRNQVQTIINWWGALLTNLRHKDRYESPFAKWC